MSVTVTPTKPVLPQPGSAPISVAELDQVDRALIDASASGPVLFFYTTAITWLLAATVFGFISSMKMHSPEFLGGWSFLTYGRIWPAYIDTLTYGWACPAGMGTLIWLMVRLCRVSLRKPALLVFGGIFWNIGVTVGVVNILLGVNSGHALLEFPSSASAILFIAYSLIAIWGVAVFENRRPGPVYVSLWYLVGALFWFPWLYGAANLMLTVLHVRGVMQSIVVAWFGANFIGLWMGAIGLASVYYFIPKVTGRPVASYYLASIGFWSFALFYPWLGGAHLAGSPVPVWMPTMGIAASIMSVVTLATVFVNFAMTMRGSYNMIYHSPTIRFTFYGAVAFIVTGLVNMIGSFRSVDRLTHFTEFGAGELHLGVYAFFSMAMFGAIYYIAPRLVGCEWLSATMIRLHFWASAYGIGLLICMMLFGGLAHGSAMDNTGQPFESVIEMGQPYMRGQTVAWIVLIIGHAFFTINFLLMILRFGKPAGQPTLFAPMEGEPH